MRGGGHDGRTRADGDAAVPEGDVTAWATETARKADAPPVVFLAPSGPRVMWALETDVAEYLPRTAVERAPATVLRRAVNVATDSGTAGYRAIYDNVSKPLTLHDPGTGESVHADRRLCEPLGYDRGELIENAVEHGGDAPSVAVRTADDDDRRTITVVDDGPGIPDHVLTPFWAGGETQLRRNHGLGLWVVSWGVRRLGGGIEFERPADTGTAVRSCLP